MDNQLIIKLNKDDEMRIEILDELYADCYYKLKGIEFLVTRRVKDLDSGAFIYYAISIEYLNSCLSL